MHHRGSTALAACVLVASSALAPAATAQSWIGDDAHFVFDIRHAEFVQGCAQGHDTHAGGDVAVSVGELRDNCGQSSSVRVAFARAFDRRTGAERWTRLDPRCQVALAVAVDPTGSQVWIVERLPGEGSTDGSERTLVLDATSGATLFETERALPVDDARSFSTVDTLAFSADGSRLLRLDHFQQSGEPWMRVEAFDPTNGQLLWASERAAADPHALFESDAYDSLAVSPDGQTVYLTCESPDAATGWQDRDTCVVALAAATGAERWSRTFSTAATVDRISGPMPTADSTGVLVTTHVLPPTAPSGQLRRLDAATGTDVWSSPLGQIPWIACLSPDGARVATGAFVGSAAPPNGTDVGLECFDAATGAQQWIATAPQVGTLDDPVGLRFSPDGARLFVHVSRRDLATPFDPFHQVLSVDATSGGGLVATDVIAPVDADESALWIDAIDSVGGGSQATIGAAFDQLSLAAGAALEPRAGVDDQGNILFDIAASTTVEEESDAIGRVWIEPDGQHVVTWASNLDASNQHDALRLQRRRSEDGTVVSDVLIDSASSSVETFNPVLSPTAAHVAVQSTDATMRHLRVYETATGALAFEHQLQGAFAVFPVWSPDGARVYWATNDVAPRIGAGDVTTGQLLWEDTLASTLGPYSVFTLRGLDVDPLDGSLNVLLHESTTVSGDVEKFALTRRDGATGAQRWTLDYSAQSSLHVANVLDSRTSAGTTVPYGVDPVGVTTSADGSIVYTADVFAHPLRNITRVAATNSLDGSLLWSRGSAVGPGIDARLVDLVAARDGRFVHVLSEGRGDDPNAPLRAFLATYDGATGDYLWQGFAAEPATRVRSITSLGEGGRIALVVARADAAGAPVGGEIAILEADTGIELSRLELDHWSEVIDAAFDESGRIFCVGTTPGDLVGVDGILARYDGARMQIGPQALSVSSGGRSFVALDLPPERAGEIYLVLGSATGASRGIALGGGLVLALVHDFYTDFTVVGANSQFFPNSYAPLDPAGDGESAVVLPPGTDPALVGLPFCYAALVVDPATGATTAITQTVDFALVP